MKNKKVLIVGLGRLRKRVCQSLVNSHTGFEIVGVTGVSPLGSTADELGYFDIPCFEIMEDAIQKLGSGVDIILDTSANHSLQKVADQLLIQNHNYHTVTTSIEDYLQG